MPTLTRKQQRDADAAETEEDDKIKPNDKKPRKPRGTKGGKENKDNKNTTKKDDKDKKNGTKKDDKGKKNTTDKDKKNTTKKDDKDKKNTTKKDDKGKKNDTKKDDKDKKNTTDKDKKNTTKKDAKDKNPDEGKGNDHENEEKMTGKKGDRKKRPAVETAEVEKPKDKKRARGDGEEAVTFGGRWEPTEEVAKKKFHSIRKVFREFCQHRLRSPSTIAPVWYTLCTRKFREQQIADDGDFVAAAELLVTEFLDSDKVRALALLTSRMFWLKKLVTQNEFG